MDIEDLVFRFWNLASSERREIALSLGLITADDMSLVESKRYKLAFTRAKEQNLIPRLIEEITKREKD